MAETDTDLTTHFVIYGTTAAGGELPIMIPGLTGRQCWQGIMYPTSLQYPMLDAAFAGTIAQADPLTVSGYQVEAYDDFNQFTPATGLFTCSNRGVYHFTGSVQFNGNATAF